MLTQTAISGGAPITTEGLVEYKNHLRKKAEAVASCQYAVELNEGTMEDACSRLSKSWRFEHDPRINGTNFPYVKESKAISIGFDLRPSGQQIKLKDAGQWALKKSGAQRLARPYEVVCWALQHTDKTNDADVWCPFPSVLLAEKDGRLFWNVMRFECYLYKRFRLWSIARQFEESTLDCDSKCLIPVVYGSLR